MKYKIGESVRIKNIPCDKSAPAYDYYQKTYRGKVYKVKDAVPGGPGKYPMVLYDLDFVKPDPRYGSVPFVFSEFDLEPVSAEEGRQWIVKCPCCGEAERNDTLERRHLVQQPECKKWFDDRKVAVMDFVNEAKGKFYSLLECQKCGFQWVGGDPCYLDPRYECVPEERRDDRGCPKCGAKNPGGSIRRVDYVRREGYEAGGGEEMSKGEVGAEEYDWKKWYPCYRCVKCGFEWLSLPGDKGKGCPKCNIDMTSVQVACLSLREGYEAPKIKYKIGDSVRIKNVPIDRAAGAAYDMYQKEYHGKVCKVTNIVPRPGSKEILYDTDVEGLAGHPFPFVFGEEDIEPAGGGEEPGKGEKHALYGCSKCGFEWLSLPGLGYVSKGCPKCGAPPISCNLLSVSLREGYEAPDTNEWIVKCPVCGRAQLSGGFVGHLATSKKCARHFSTMEAMDWIVECKRRPFYPIWRCTGCSYEWLGLDSGPLRDAVCPKCGKNALPTGYAQRESYEAPKAYASAGGPEKIEVGKGEILGAPEDKSSSVSFARLPDWAWDRLKDVRGMGKKSFKVFYLSVMCGDCGSHFLDPGVATGRETWLRYEECPKCGSPPSAFLVDVTLKARTGYEAPAGGTEPPEVGKGAPYPYRRCDKCHYEWLALAGGGGVRGVVNRCPRCGEKISWYVDSFRREGYEAADGPEKGKGEVLGAEEPVRWIVKCPRCGEPEWNDSLERHLDQNRLCRSWFTERSKSVADFVNEAKGKYYPSLVCGKCGFKWVGGDPCYELMPGDWTRGCPKCGAKGFSGKIRRVDYVRREGYEAPSLPAAPFEHWFVKCPCCGELERNDNFISIHLAVNHDCEKWFKDRGVSSVNYVKECREGVFYPVMKCGCGYEWLSRDIVPTIQTKCPKCGKSISRVGSIQIVGSFRREGYEAGGKKVGKGEDDSFILDLVKCPVCGVTYPAESFKEHIRSRRKSIWPVLRKCADAFKDDTEVLRYIEESRKIPWRPSYRCDLCGFQWLALTGLENWPCPKCGHKNKTYVGAFQCRGYEAPAGGKGEVGAPLYLDEVVKCPICGLPLKNRDLIKHLDKFRNCAKGICPKPPTDKRLRAKCPVCDRTEDVSDFISHLAESEECARKFGLRELLDFLDCKNRPFYPVWRCGKCDFSWLGRSPHPGSRKCPRCGQDDRTIAVDFTRRENYESPVEKLSAPGKTGKVLSWNVKCPVCGRIMDSGMFGSHLKMDKPYKSCAKHFTLREAKDYVAECQRRPFYPLCKCRDCGYCWLGSSVLTTLGSIPKFHGNELYPCPKCGSAASDIYDFAQRTSYEAPVEGGVAWDDPHSPLKCPVCKKFVNKEDFFDHLAKTDSKCGRQLTLEQVTSFIAGCETNPFYPVWKCGDCGYSWLGTFRIKIPGTVGQIYCPKCGSPLADLEDFAQRKSYEAPEDKSPSVPFDELPDWARGRIKEWATATGQWPLLKEKSFKVFHLSVMCGGCKFRFLDPGVETGQETWLRYEQCPKCGSDDLIFGKEAVREGYEAPAGGPEIIEVGKGGDDPKVGEWWLCTGQVTEGSYYVKSIDESGPYKYKLVDIEGRALFGMRQDLIRRLDFYPVLKCGCGYEWLSREQRPTIQTRCPKCGKSITLNGKNPIQIVGSVCREGYEAPEFKAKSEERQGFEAPEREWAWHELPDWAKAPRSSKLTPEQSPFLLRNVPTNCECGFIWLNAHVFSKYKQRGEEDRVWKYNLCPKCGKDTVHVWKLALRENITRQGYEAEPPKIWGEDEPVLTFDELPDWAKNHPYITAEPGRYKDFRFQRRLVKIECEKCNDTFLNDCFKLMKPPSTEVYTYINRTSNKFYHIICPRCGGIEHRSTFLTGKREGYEAPYEDPQRAPVWGADFEWLSPVIAILQKDYLGRFLRAPFSYVRYHKCPRCGETGTPPQPDFEKPVFGREGYEAPGGNKEMGKGDWPDWLSKRISREGFVRAESSNYMVYCPTCGKTWSSPSAKVWWERSSGIGVSKYTSLYFKYSLCPFCGGSSGRPAGYTFDNREGYESPSYKVGDIVRVKKGYWRFPKTGRIVTEKGTGRPYVIEITHKDGTKRQYSLIDSDIIGPGLSISDEDAVKVKEIEVEGLAFIRCRKCGFEWLTFPEEHGDNRYTCPKCGEVLEEWDYEPIIEGAGPFGKFHREGYEAAGGGKKMGKGETEPKAGMKFEKLPDWARKTILKRTTGEERKGATYKVLYFSLRCAKCGQVFLARNITIDSPLIRPTFSSTVPGSFFYDASCPKCGSNVFSHMETYSERKGYEAPSTWTKLTIEEVPSWAWEGLGPNVSLDFIKKYFKRASLSRDFLTCTKCSFKWLTPTVWFEAKKTGGRHTVNGVRKWSKCPRCGAESRPLREKDQYLPATGYEAAGGVDKLGKGENPLGFIEQRAVVSCKERGAVD